MTSRATSGTPEDARDLRAPAAAARRPEQREAAGAGVARALDRHAAAALEERLADEEAAALLEQHDARAAGRRRRRRRGPGLAARLAPVAARYPRHEGARTASARSRASSRFVVFGSSGAFTSGWIPDPVATPLPPRLRPFGVKYWPGGDVERAAVGELDDLLEDALAERPRRRRPSRGGGPAARR